MRVVEDKGRGEGEGLSETRGSEERDCWPETPSSPGTATKWPENYLFSATLTDLHGTHRIQNMTHDSGAWILMCNSNIEGRF